MKIHFIAIGGAAMHNLALALQQKGYEISGSDDEIFDPSKSRLKKQGLLPPEFGWYPEKINNTIDAVILGMHARADNPELLKAQEIGVKIYSYPEFLYEQTKNKKRIVIGGSHGKTSITSMVMHVFKEAGVKFDYMVGAQIDGFSTMVALSDDTEYAVFEGDEYLSSPIDKRPKFHLYHPHIALLSGIGWDHINVFPTFEIYLEQFRVFIEKIEPLGQLIYFEKDSELVKLIDNCSRRDLSFISYSTPAHTIEKGKTFIKNNKSEHIPLEVFGEHNLQNIAGAREICFRAGISQDVFYSAISSFKGSAKRLQKLYESEDKLVFIDFAHSPSKLKGTIKAVKEQFSEWEVVVVYELHTFSSLTKDFLQQYNNSLNLADQALVYFNPAVVKSKKLPAIKALEIIKGFGLPQLEVYTDTSELKKSLKDKVNREYQVFLFMSSGNFGGLGFEEMVRIITG
ncbi:MAG TPA: peptidoglycan synthetase [Bacteroidales bacterium]|jgi:UDP-N-acetylmuramate: L-alanyl-gamma-D-glutamyl-meso-diaminopimelate ligase|nr:peptidoglycan synthetase [Bacteroidales bacterium]